MPKAKKKKALTSDQDGKATMVVPLYDGTRELIQAKDFLVRIFDGSQNQLFDDYRPRRRSSVSRTGVICRIVAPFSRLATATWMRVLLRLNVVAEVYGPDYKGQIESKYQRLSQEPGASRLCDGGCRWGRRKPGVRIMKMSDAIDKLQLPDGYKVKQYKGTTMPERTDRFSMKCLGQEWPWRFSGKNWKRDPERLEGYC